MRDIRAFIFNCKKINSLCCLRHGVIAIHLHTHMHMFVKGKLSFASKRAETPTCAA